MCSESMISIFKLSIDEKIEADVELIMSLDNPLELIKKTVDKATKGEISVNRAMYVCFMLGRLEAVSEPVAIMKWAEWLESLKMLRDKELIRAVLKKQAEVVAEVMENDQNMASNSESRDIADKSYV